MNITKEKHHTAFEALKKNFSWKNSLQAPKIEKVVVSVGIGSTKDKRKIEIIEDRLTKITGQKPAPRGAKQAIAGFKIREKDVVGYQVTLRGQRMYDFLDKLLHVALPRTRDFRGLKPSSIDDMGNYTLGISEHTIFPETSDEELRDIFGLAVTVVTTVNDKDEVKSYLKHLGFPIQKES